jgi:hypothetical protein
METNEGFIPDEVLGNRLFISKNADPREIASNIRAARSILFSFPETNIIINAHQYLVGVSNPEYTINGQLGDRKGIMSEKGVTAGFKSAKKQGCKYVVIDLDEHIGNVRPFELSKYISRRKTDFVSNLILDCYVVYNGNAAIVNAGKQSRQEIEECLKKLKP